MKPPPARAWHYVSRNETTRVPRRHVFLDTEARMERTATGHVQRWRLGVAHFYRHIKGRRTVESQSDFIDPGDMWRRIDAHAGKDDRTIVWAHNLSYDVRISRALEFLPKLGWALSAHNLTSRGMWLHFKRDKASLILVDSMSVFPKSLQKVGECFGMGKPSLPDNDDSDAAWFLRCRADVAILRRAILCYLHWLETADLGNWQITGAGQSWATFRHRFLTHKLLVHSDETALAAERRAMWTGRCEAYWHGNLERQVVHEWDFTLAYARIARDHCVPVRLLGPMPDGYDWRNTVESANVALLADVTVRTPVPVVPAQHDGRILWPAGEFQTTLWDVEIRAALDAGAEIEVHGGWLYHLRPALKDWATWLIEQLEGPDDIVPAWRKLVLKHWARALIGRMSMTYRQWEEFAFTNGHDVKRSMVYDRDTGEQYDTMQIGGTIWRDTGRVEWRESMPMITGYIQALCRVRLWNVMCALPEKVLLYVDTDSILVTDRHLSAVAKIAESDIGSGLRLKRSWDGFAIYGPRQIVTGNEIRVSGVPKRATRVERNKYAGEIWDSITTSLRSGNPDRVITRDRIWEITGVDHRRDGPAIGWTQPITIGGDHDRTSERQGSRPGAGQPAGHRGRRDQRATPRVPGPAGPERPRERPAPRRHRQRSRDTGR